MTFVASAEVLDNIGRSLMYSATIPYISDKTPSLGSYFIVYKSLLALAPSLGLDIDEVFLYSVLRDRATISAENEWIDKSGRVYVIYTRTQIAEETGWSKRKVIDAFRALSDANLIEEEVQKTVLDAMWHLEFM